MRPPTIGFDLIVDSVGALSPPRFPFFHPRTADVRAACAVMWVLLSTSYITPGWTRLESISSRGVFSERLFYRAAQMPG